jgi:hypothetical protein
MGAPGLSTQTHVPAESAISRTHHVWFVSTTSIRTSCVEVASARSVDRRLIKVEIGVTDFSGN